MDSKYTSLDKEAFELLNPTKILEKLKKNLVPKPFSVHQSSGWVIVPMWTETHSVVSGLSGFITNLFFPPSVHAAFLHARKPR